MMRPQVIRRSLQAIGCISIILICVYLVFLEHTSIRDTGQGRLVRELLRKELEEKNTMLRRGIISSGLTLNTDDARTSGHESTYQHNHLSADRNNVHNHTSLVYRNSLFQIKNVSQRFDEAAERVKVIPEMHLEKVRYPGIGIHRRAWNFTITAADCSPEVENLIILVPTTPDNFINRAVIRSIWGNRTRLKEIKSSIIFVVGLSSNTLTDSIIISESLQFKDIVQMDIVDSYYNLTLKTLGMLTWAARHCKTPKYVAKVDDDNILNFPRILEMLNIFHEQHDKFIAGNHQPLTSPKIDGKWFDPVYHMVYQAGPYYPPFHGGPAYFLTNNFLNDLLEKCLELPLIHLEDVFVTGICAGQIKDVQKLHLGGMYRSPLGGCNFTLPNVTMAHDYKLLQLKPTWDKWHSATCNLASNLDLSTKHTFVFCIFVVVINVFL